MTAKTAHTTKEIFRFQYDRGLLINVLQRNFYGIQLFNLSRIARRLILTCQWVVAQVQINKIALGRFCGQQACAD